MSEQGIQIPDDTIVNGHPFKKYKELQERIAELETTIEILTKVCALPMPKPEADCVCLECVSCGETHKLYNLQTYEGGLHCAECLVKRIAELDAQLNIQNPPPCPELPYGFDWFGRGALEINHPTKGSIDNWIEALDKIKSIRDHIEKWGTA